MGRQRHERRRMRGLMKTLQSFAAAVRRLDLEQDLSIWYCGHGRPALLRRALRRLGGVVEDQGHYASSALLLVGLMYRAVAPQLGARAARLWSEASRRSPACVCRSDVAYEAPFAALASWLTVGGKDSRVGGSP